MTEAQLIANRANAQLSTGPRTEEGKRPSSLNAFRHGLTGQIVIHTPEDQAAFQKHCEAIREALAPVGALEFDLAQAIAEDKWRLNRARALEKPFSPKAIGRIPTPRTPPTPRETPPTWVQQAKNLQLLTTYEQRIRRSVEKNLAELKALQADRKSAIEKAEHEARLLVQLAEAEEAEGRNYDPSMDFPPESRPLGSFFRGRRLSASSKANSASAKPVASSMANVGRAILPAAAFPGGSPFLRGAPCALTASAPGSSIKT